jgi:DHA1 family inner membrane transport protein
VVKRHDVTRRQLFGSLCALVFFVNLGRVVFAPLLEPLRAAFGVDSATLGLLATLVWIGSASPRLPTGYLLTRVPRHYVVFATGGLLTFATALTSVAPGIRALQGGAFLMGVASGAYFIAANPLVSELFPDRVGRVLGIHGMASQVAAVSAPLFVTGILVIGDWRTAFQVMSVGAFLSTMLFTVTAWRVALPEAGLEDRNMLEAIREQWLIVLTGVVMLGATAFVWQGVFNFYVRYLIVGKGLTEQTGNLLLSVAFGAGVPAFYVSGRLADRLPIVSYLLSLLAIFAALVLTFTAASGIVALVAVSVGLGLTIHSLFPAIDTYLLGSLPDRHRGSAYAAYSASMMTIQSTGSWVVGSLTEAGYTFDTVFQTAALGLVAVVLVLALAHSQGRLPATARA